MKLKSLSEVKRSEPEEIWFGALPREIWITEYARSKAFLISKLVREIHGSSFEWYGFTLANREDPEIIIDIGLPFNDKNVHQSTGIGPEHISVYQDSVGMGLFINGWIHSHGNMNYKKFSGTDENNHLTVLDYVSALMRKPVSKRAIRVEDMTLLVEGRWMNEDLVQGSVSLVTDVPVARVKMFEAVYGSFSYAIVIGDSGWSVHAIHYKQRGILTGQTSVSRSSAKLRVIEPERKLAGSDVDELRRQVRERIRPEESTEPKA